jgi:hypothetical protein
MNKEERRREVVKSKDIKSSACQADIPKVTSMVEYQTSRIIRPLQSPHS